MLINLTSNSNLGINEKWHYLSPYQMSYEEAALSEDINDICEDYPYDILTAERVRAATEKVFDRIWENIYEDLSNYSDVKLGLDFWKYYSSYDFFYFINIYYERFVEIQTVVKKYENVVFILGYRPDDYFISRKYNRYTVDRQYENIVKAIDWQIIDYFGCSTICVNENDNVDLEKDGIDTANKQRRKLKDLVKLATNRIYCGLLGKDVIVVEDSGAKIGERLHLIVKYPMRVWFPDNCEWDGRFSDYAIDSFFRERVLKEKRIFMEDEFDKVFFENLYKNLFVQFVEGFKGIWKHNSRYLRVQTKCIIRGSMSEESLMRAAYVYDRGGTTVNVAHSMQESFMKVLFAKTPEYADYLVEWAGPSLLALTKSRSCFGSRLRDIKKIDYVFNEEVLFVFSGETILKYIRKDYNIACRKRASITGDTRAAKDLYDTLREDIIRKVRFRVREVFDNKQREFVIHNCPLSIVDEYKPGVGVSLIDRIGKARIVICETIYTTSFFEALISGVPVIVINKHSYGEYYGDKIETIRNRLLDVGVVVKDGKTAALTINSNYDRIEEWWNEEERQSVINEFINECGIYKSNGCGWVEALIREMVS